MFIETLKTIKLYERQSKLGVYHTYKRRNTVYVFECDSCGVEFLRPRSKVDPERATNEYKHICPYCDSKQFAKSVGIDLDRVYTSDKKSLVVIDKDTLVDVDDRD